jgi:hypothetical protein
VTQRHFSYLSGTFRESNIVRVIKSRRLTWAGHVARMEEVRSAFKTGKPTGKKPLGRPRCRWEDNIRMDLEEIGDNVWNWVDSVQDRDYLESPCECGIDPPGFISQELSYYYYYP